MAACNQFGLRDEVLESVIALAKKYNIERLYLFGSRARGDYAERSDIDLAASGGNVAAFLMDVEEFAPTLLFFDVVNLNKHVSEYLLQELRRDGVLIYEKS